MNDLPFTDAQFFQVFRDYNAQIWPAQFILVAIALLIGWAALRPSPARGRVALLGLAALWLWGGIVYHWLHFATVNPAARLFGALFVLQGILLADTAGRGRARPEYRSDAPGVAGAVLVVAALVLYPLAGWLAGADYLGSPTFGAPCPLTIFTFGVLLWLRPRMSVALLVIPVLWAAAGSVAFIALGVYQDVMLPLAALVAVAIRVAGRRTSPVATSAG